jgi:predicted CoA-binding protein
MKPKSLRIGDLTRTENLISLALRPIRGFGYPMTELDLQQTIENILRESCTVAVVGLSSNPERDSYDVARYLQSMGYRIIPVNPNEAEVLGQRAYPDLLSIPGAVDVVDIFRRSEAVPPIVEQAIEIGAKAVWMQKGIRNEQAAQRAVAAGLLVVMDHCMLEETRRLIQRGTFEGPCSK